MRANPPTSFDRTEPPKDGRFVDLRGRRFGRLTVARYAGAVKRIHWWQCACDCGRATTVCRENLGRHTFSCGCLHSDVSGGVVKHGQSGSGIYKIWIGVLDRCTNSGRPYSKYYVDRGITVCDRWRYGEDGKTGFECFLDDMGQRPSPDLSIDRIDNDGNYEPSNCRWATRSQQQRNKRKKA